MKGLVRKLSVVWSAGALGGLLNGVALWLFGVLGITATLGVSIAPQFTPPWLYPRLVWGGIWGALFLLPLMRGSVWLRGLVYSMGPTLVQLFIVFPLKADKGMLGLDLGAATPLFVVILNAVWGIAAAWWVVKGSEPAPVPVQAQSNPIQ